MPLFHDVLNLYDILLIIVVSIQATCVAYLRQPRWKVFLLSIPFPFTLMVLALGRPINSTNLLGLFFLLLFTHAVRLLNQRLIVPIIPAIAFSALGYFLLSSLVVPFLSITEKSFWLTWIIIVAIGIFLYVKLPERNEQEYRTEMPLWIKLPIIIAITVFLVIFRNTIQGFATVFPLVGIIAVYESRYSLWTIGRQIPVIMVSMGSMMALVYLTQPYYGLFQALVVGWIIFLLVFLAFTIHMWSRIDRPVKSSLVS